MTELSLHSQSAVCRLGNRSPFLAYSKSVSLSPVEHKPRYLMALIYMFSANVHVQLQPEMDLDWVPVTQTV